MMVTTQTRPMHEAFISQYPEEAARVFENYPVHEILEVLRGTSRHDISKILMTMTPSLAAEILEAMPIELLQETLIEIDPAAGCLAVTKIIRTKASSGTRNGTQQHRYRN